jgi:AcrR family transcriptional regulator
VPTTPSPFVAALRGGAGTFRPGPRAAESPDAAAGHRARLIAAMAEAVAEHGFATATVADVVRRAQVSRRTFYEHFDGRDACLLATYDACSDLLMAQIAQAVAAAEPSWEQRVAAGVAAYLEAMADEPGLARVFLLDFLALGPEALRRRGAVHGRFTDLVLDLAVLHREELAGAEALDRDVVAALIGAVNELVLVAVTEDRGEHLRDAMPTARGSCARCCSPRCPTRSRGRERARPGDRRGQRDRRRDRPAPARPRCAGARPGPRGTRRRRARVRRDRPGRRRRRGGRGDRAARWPRRARQQRRDRHAAERGRGAGRRRRARARDQPARALARDLRGAAGAAHGARAGDQRRVGDSRT